MSDLFFHLAETCPALVALLQDGRILHLNGPARRSLAGSPHATLLGMPFARLIDPDHREVLGALINAEIELEEAIPIRLRPMIGGSLEVVLTLRRGSHGGRSVQLVVAEDVSAVTRATDAARSSRALLDSVLRTVTDGVVVIDRTGRIDAVNEVGERMFGYAAGELVGRHVGCLMSPDERSAHDRHLAAYGGSAQSRVIGRGRDLRGLRKDGGEFPIELTVSEMHRDGELGFVGILKDLTERRERDTLRARFQFAQKMEMVGTLAGGVAHDLNNIVNIVIAHAEAALDQLPQGSPPGREMEGILTAGWRAADILRQLLSLSRSDACEGEVSLAMLLREVVDLLAPIAPANVTMALAVGDDAHLVRGRSTQLHQAVINLCLNAIQAIGEAEGLIEIRVSDADITAATLAPPPAPAEGETSDVWLGRLRPGPHVCVMVRDTGCGMSRDIARRAFEPFFTTKAAGKGTGLGLAAALGIVTGHGGAIRMQTAPGAGSTFTAYLPRAA